MDQLEKYREKMRTDKLYVELSSGGISSENLNGEKMKQCIGQKILQKRVQNLSHRPSPLSPRLLIPG